MVMSVRAALVAALSRMSEALCIIREPCTRLLSHRDLWPFCFWKLPHHTCEAKARGARKFRAFGWNRGPSHTVASEPDKYRAHGGGNISLRTMSPSLGTTSLNQLAC